MSDPNVKYKGTTTRAQWRSLYLKCESVSPKNRVVQRWLSVAASELFDVAEVRIKPGGINAKRMEKPTEQVTLELSRDCVKGIQHAVIDTLLGTTSGMPAANAERRDLLDAVKDIGPGGKLVRLIEKEAKLPDSDDLDDDEDPFEDNVDAPEPDEPDKPNEPDKK